MDQASALPGKMTAADWEVKRHEYCQQNTLFLEAYEHEFHGLTWMEDPSEFEGILEVLDVVEPIYAGLAHLTPGVDLLLTATVCAG